MLENRHQLCGCYGTQILARLPYKSVPLVKATNEFLVSYDVISLM